MKKFSIILIVILSCNNLFAIDFFFINIPYKDLIKNYFLQEIRYQYNLEYFYGSKYDQADVAFSGLNLILLGLDPKIKTVNGRLNQVGFELNPITNLSTDFPLSISPYFLKNTHCSDYSIGINATLRPRKLF